MENVNFYPQTFVEIREQDNPAFGNDECTMIVKEDKTARSVVLYINPIQNDQVNEVAIFTSLHNAIDFCGIYEPLVIQF